MRNIVLLGYGRSETILKRSADCTSSAPWSLSQIHSDFLGRDGNGLPLEGEAAGMACRQGFILVVFIVDRGLRLGHQPLGLHGAWCGRGLNAQAALVQSSMANLTFLVSFALVRYNLRCLRHGFRISQIVMSDRPQFLVQLIYRGYSGRNIQC